MGSLRALCLCGLGMLVVAASAVAQSNFGSIRGQVLDASGAAVPNAKVSIRDVGTNQSVQLISSGEGFFIASSLRPVTYEVTVEAPGFQKSTLGDVKVDTAKITTVDVMLKPGNVSETVVVTASVGPVLQTYTGAVTSTVDQRAIVETPLNGRNVLELALTLPGVAGDVGSEIGSSSNVPPIPGREVIVNGGRPGTTQFVADGQNITGVGLGRTAVSFSPDTIQEFSILQSNYSAEYSQAGGGIILQTTKSGTNVLKGTGYWFHRQRAFTANPFLSQRVPELNYDNRAPLRRQQFGLVLGGPVELPKVYHGKNKTFFLFSYEPTRQVQGSQGATFERVPTDLEINGDFSQSYSYDSAGTRRQYPLLYNHFVKNSSGTLHYLPNPAYNPALPVSGQNPLYAYVDFPLFNPNDPDPNRRGRVLVDGGGKSYVNPVAQRIARELYPRPNIPMITSGSNAGANYVYFGRTANLDNRYTTRLDHKAGDKHTLNGRWTEQPLYADRYSRDPVKNPGTSDTSLSRQIALSATSILRANLVNEFRGGYVYGNFARNFPSQYLSTDGTTPFLDIGGPGKGMPNFLGFGLADFYSNGGPADSARTFGRIGFAGIQNVGRNTEHRYSLTDDLSWIQGSRTIKLGFQGGHLQSNAAAPGYGYQGGGRFNFAATTNNDAVGCSAPNVSPLPADCRNATARTGDPFAAFLEGVSAYTFAYENIAQPYYYRWKSFGNYAQVDWKIRPNLTLNVGLRHQYQSPRWEKFNRQGQLNLNRMEPNPYSLDANGKPLLAPVFEFAGFDGRSRYLSVPQYLDFEPRLGFAWVPHAFNRKLVVRGGYGITHSVLTGRNRIPFPNLGSKADAHRAYNVVFGTTEINNPSNVGGCGFAICTSDIPGQYGYNNVVYQPDPTLFRMSENGLIRPGDAGKTVSGVTLQDRRYPQTGFVFDPKFQTPMVQNFSFELQYEVAERTVLTLGWRGSRGTHLYNTPRELNTNPFDGTRNYPGFNGTASGRIMLLDETSSGSIYHAGIVELERRFSKGLQFRINYTFSKSIDDASGAIEPDFANLAGQDRGAETIRGNPPQNSFGRTSERAVSNFDTPHIFNFLTFWELPFGQGRRFLSRGGILQHIAGGWQITGLGRISSGPPAFLDLGNSNNLFYAGATFQANPRPNVVAGVPLKNPDWSIERATTVPYLNPRAFSIPDPAAFGNASRTISQLRMPFLRTFDASVFKNIYPFENRSRFFQLRAEGFNVLNMKSYGFGGVGTSLFSGLNQNKPGEPNRYANLNTRVWDAIIKQDPSGLTGAATAPAGASLSELGVYTDLVSRYSRTSFYTFGSSSQNAVRSRILQFALKFYF